MAGKPNRNAPCHCGSGKKYKNCCQKKDDSGQWSKFAMIGAVVAVLFALVITVMVLSGGNGQPDCPPGTVWSEEHQHCH